MMGRTPSPFEGDLLRCEHGLKDPCPECDPYVYSRTHTEREKSHCGTCSRQLRILNPNSRRLVTCPACRGKGIR